MTLPAWAVYAAMEVAGGAVVLLLLVLYGSVRLSRRLQAAERTVAERNSRIKALQEEAKLFSAAPPPSSGFAEGLALQLQQCRERYGQLQGLDISQDHLLATARLPLRVAALRNAYLEIEAEAANDPERSWRVLDVRLSVLLRQLCAHEAQRVVEEVVQTVAARASAIKPELIRELEHLREVTEEQQQQIEVLEARLQAAGTDEDKDKLLVDMHEQLNRQARYMKEAESCINQLEAELRAATDQLHEADKDIARLKDYSQELEALVGNFAAQSHEMMEAIGALEKETAALHSGEEVVEGKLIEGEVAPESLARDAAEATTTEGLARENDSPAA